MPAPSPDSLDAKFAQAEDSTLASKLTPSELLFADLLSRGSPLNQAFIKSHPQSKSVINRNQSAISVAANRVLNRPHVSSYLDALRKPSLFTTCLSRDQKRAKLAELVATCPDPAIVLRAIDIDNDMSGDRAPKTSLSLSPSLAIADRLLSGLAARPELPRPTGDHQQGGGVLGETPREIAEGKGEVSGECNTEKM